MNNKREPSAIKEMTDKDRGVQPLVHIVLEHNGLPHAADVPEWLVENIRDRNKKIIEALSDQISVRNAIARTASLAAFIGVAYGITVGAVMERTASDTVVAWVEFACAAAMYVMVGVNLIRYLRRRAKAKRRGS